MFFTSIARIAAWLMTLLGAFHVALGFSVVFGSSSPEAITRYIGSKSVGEAIDQGFMVFAVGIVIGVLTDISKSARNQQSDS